MCLKLLFLNYYSISNDHDFPNYRSRTLSRQPSLNVLQHKKQITLPNKVERIPVAPKKEGNTIIIFVTIETVSDSVRKFVFLFFG